MKIAEQAPKITVFKSTFLVSLTLGLAFATSAGVFSFSDVAGFEKCFQLSGLTETAVENNVSVKHELETADIHERCINSARILLTDKAKDQALMTSFIRAVSQNSSHENALPLIALAVGANLEACNQMENYRILIKALGHPRHDPTEHLSYVSQASKILKICLANKEFKQDLIDEKDSADAYVQSNVCAFLKNEKILKTCVSKIK